jgi:hypothetical protein
MPIEFPKEMDCKRYEMSVVRNSILRKNPEDGSSADLLSHPDVVSDVGA